MTERPPYDQGWLDGAEHTAKTYDGWNERDKTLNAAVDKLKAHLDQSDRVRALEAALVAARDVMLCARPHCLYTSVEADIDEWLAANPAPLTSAPERKKDGL